MNKGVLYSYRKHFDIGKMYYMALVLQRFQAIPSPAVMTGKMAALKSVSESRRRGRCREGKERDRSGFKQSTVTLTMTNNR